MISLTLQSTHNNTCMYNDVIFTFFKIYRSVTGKRLWALKHNSRFWPAWALTRDIISICLYRSCYIDPLKYYITWALTWECGTLRYTYNCTICIGLSVCSNNNNIIIMQGCTIYKQDESVFIGKHSKGSDAEVSGELKLCMESIA